MGIVSWLLGGLVNKLVSTAIVLALVAGVIYFLAQGLNQASVERFELTGIKDITTDSFTLSGNLYARNPSKLPIPIRDITYDVVLKDTRERIASGSVPAFVLGAATTTRIPFDQTIRWVPTAELAVRLATQEHVYAIVTGKVHIDLPEIGKYDVPFKAEVDIKEYVLRFATGALPVESPLPPAPIAPPPSGGLLPGKIL